MSVKDLPTKPSKPLPKCAEHARRTCYICLHSYNCDDKGHHNSSIQYAAKRGLEKSQLKGLDALFIPQLDAHVGLSTGVSSSSMGLRAGYEENEETAEFDLVTPPPMAPGDEWFYFCHACSTTWLSGQEGPLAASTHPSHTALRDKRTLFVWIGTSVTAARARDGSTNDDRNPPQQQRQQKFIGHVSFGRASRYNETVEAGTRADCQVKATMRCFEIVRKKIMRRRREMVEETTKTNSDSFLDKAKAFRLVAVLSDRSLVEFFSGVGSRFIWNGRRKEYATRYGDEIRGLSRYDHSDLRDLEWEVERLGRLDIMVKWYLVNPEVNAGLSRDKPDNIPSRNPGSQKPENRQNDRVNGRPSAAPGAGSMTRAQNGPSEPQRKVGRDEHKRSDTNIRR